LVRRVKAVYYFLNFTVDIEHSIVESLNTHINIHNHKNQYEANCDNVLNYQTVLILAVNPCRILQNNIIVKQVSIVDQKPRVSEGK
jgi:hypothetical protein